MPKNNHENVVSTGEVDDLVRRSTLTRRQKDMMSTLAHNPRATDWQLSLSLGIATKAVRETLTELEKIGTIAKVGGQS